MIKQSRLFPSMCCGLATVVATTGAAAGAAVIRTQTLAFSGQPEAKASVGQMTLRTRPLEFTGQVIEPSSGKATLRTPPLVFTGSPSSGGSR